jgi:hypothetical protein
VLYLAAMATGLREAHGWSIAQIDRYLAALPGCSVEHRLRRKGTLTGPHDSSQNRSFAQSTGQPELS